MKIRHAIRATLKPFVLSGAIETALSFGLRNVLLPPVAITEDAPFDEDYDCTAIMGVALPAESVSSSESVLGSVAYPVNQSESAAASETIDATVT